MRPLVLFAVAVVLCGFACGCSAFARRERSAEQIAAEAVLLGKRSTLLERENQILREENLALARDVDILRSEQQKKDAEASAERERLLAQLKAAETTIANLNEKISILESESSGKLRQLTALNEQLAKKYAENQRRLQEELSRIQLETAQERERLAKESAEKQFLLGKEVQELKQRLAEREKEIHELRTQLNALRASESALLQQLENLKAENLPQKQP